jgi:hypothetical protein
VTLKAFINFSLRAQQNVLTVLKIWRTYMKKLINIGLAVLISSYTSIAWAGKDSEEENSNLAAQNTQSLENTNLTPHLSIQAYIEANPDQRRLLLPCGHQPINDKFYSQGLTGSYNIHQHQGWYTVDINPDLEPDLIGDLNQQQTLDYIFQPTTWDIIYLEYASVAHLTPNFFSKARQSLRENGVLVYSPSLLTKWTERYVSDSKDSGAKTLILDTFSFIKNSIDEAVPPSDDDHRHVTCNSITQLEEQLKVEFHNKFGFSKVTVYADTFLDDNWMREVLRKIDTQYKEKFERLTEEWIGATPERQQEISSIILNKGNKVMAQEMKYVFENNFLLNHEGKICDTVPKNYLKYPTILDKYDMQFRFTPKLDVFVVVKK